MKKKILLVLAFVAFISVIVACNNTGKQKMDEQVLKDSIVLAVKDSIANALVEQAKQDSIKAYNALHSEEKIKKVVENFLSASKSDAPFLKYMSARVKVYIDNFNKMNEPWRLAGCSTCQFSKSSNIKVSNIDKNSATVHFFITITDETLDDYYKEKFKEHCSMNVKLVLEGSSWLIDDVLYDGKSAFWN